MRTNADEAAKANKADKVAILSLVHCFLHVARFPSNL
jgi:hypothetical protein